MLVSLLTLSCVILCAQSLLQGTALDTEAKLKLENGLPTMDSIAKASHNDPPPYPSEQGFLEYKIYSNSDSKCKGDVLFANSIRLDTCLPFNVNNPPNQPSSVKYDAVISSYIIHVGATYYTDTSCTTGASHVPDVFGPFSTTCECIPATVGLEKNNHRQAGIVTLPTQAFPTNGLIFR